MAVLRHPAAQVAIVALAHVATGAALYPATGPIGEAMLWPVPALAGDKLSGPAFAGALLANGLLWAAALVIAVRLLIRRFRTANRPAREMISIGAVLLVPVLFRYAAAGMPSPLAASVYGLPATMLLVDSPLDRIGGYRVWVYELTGLVVWLAVAWLAERALFGRDRAAQMILAAVAVAFVGFGFRTTETDRFVFERRFGYVTRVTDDWNTDGVPDGQYDFRWGLFTYSADFEPVRWRNDRDGDGRWDLWIDEERGVLRADQDGDGEPEVEVPNSGDNLRRYRDAPAP